MRAAIFQGPGAIAVGDRPDPRIEQPTDVVVRITSTGFCGSDLHMYEGRTEMQKGQVLGHENMGVIAEVGASVKALKKGDRVVIPFNIACGTCFNCVPEQTHACLTANPDAPTAGYGYAGMGPYRGGQAELLRVPWAEFNCHKLPGQAGDALEDDFSASLRRVSDRLPRHRAGMRPPGKHGRRLRPAAQRLHQGDPQAREEGRMR